MKATDTVLAELRKSATLPATAVAAGIAVLGCAGIALLNAVHVRDAPAAGRADLVGYTAPAEAVFSAAPLGAVGAVVLGVTAVSSEYAINSPGAGGGRQVLATLTAIPRRPELLVAKALVVALLVAATAAVALPVSLAIVHAVAGPVAADGLLARSVGAGIYWMLTALMAMAVTVFARGGVLPLIVLITNSSLVSVSVLLAKVTPLAFWLPDLAGMRLFAGDLVVGADRALDAPTGGLVMAAWTAALLAAAAAVLVRRDA
ncbi:ABC transporter permease [Pseudonocardia lacus]|uniref:ABC transporter permease n=1 Tax=Pseudonocardia lacus TaxID=2835865 RepID=UPI001BDD702B|nr:ABC transporter permease [Pseudonocardia lacus]